MMQVFTVVGVWPWVKMERQDLGSRKRVYEECELVKKAIHSSTKYKNKWAVTIFGEWQISQLVKAPVLDPGGLFKGYDLHKVA